MSSQTDWFSFASISKADQSSWYFEVTLSRLKTSSAVGSRGLELDDALLQI